MKAILESVLLIDKSKSNIKNKTTIDLDVIIEKIYQGYLHERNPKHVQKKTFAPSALAYGHGECPRYWYLAFEGNVFEDSATPQQIANMENGSLSHERIQDKLTKSNIELVHELDIRSSDPPIYGKADSIVNIDGQSVILEIKTVNAEGFKRILDSGSPRKYHVLQVLIYMKIKKINIGAILYECKNSHDMKIYPVVVTEEYKKYMDYLWGWMRDVYAAWNNKTIPKRPYRGQVKICQECPVFKICYELEDGVLEIKRRKKEFEC